MAQEIELQYLVCLRKLGQGFDDEIIAEFHRLLREGVWCEAFMDFIDGPPIGSSREEAFEIACEFLGLHLPTSNDQAEWLVMSYHCARIVQGKVAFREGACAIASDFPEWDCAKGGPVRQFANKLYALEDWRQAASGVHFGSMLNRELKRIDAEIWDLVSEWNGTWSARWQTLGLDWDT
ncbi:MAG: hypothetical protein ABL962_07145 [Fimbriimonadaceae bacterium]